MKHCIQAFRMLLVFTLLTGLIYPVAMTAVARVIFPQQAGGSLIVRQNEIVGSALIAQSFKEPKYFWPRPSAIDFNPLPSGGSNLGPTSKDLRAKFLERQSLGFTDDLLFASASGLDPHISPPAALHQLSRVAAARQMDEEGTKRLENLVRRYIEGPQGGFLGDPRVNVLQLNLALDEEFGRERKL